MSVMAAVNADRDELTKYTLKSLTVSRSVYIDFATRFGIDKDCYPEVFRLFTCISFSPNILALYWKLTVLKILRRNAQWIVMN